MKYDYDMVVIGGGAAGLTASGMAASFGAKTAMVEAKVLGGDCTWYGCVPSKALIKSAKVRHFMNTASKFGLSDVTPEYDFARVTRRIKEIQDSVYEEADHPDIFKKMGIDVITAKAKFVDKKNLMLISDDGERKITSRYFVIATGSSPVTPPIEGISNVKYYTNENIFKEKKLPPKLAVIGGGPIGIELTQSFQRLGSDVTVFEFSDMILPKDNRELAEMLLSKLIEEEINFHLNTQVTKVESIGDNKVVHFKNNKSGDTSSITVDEILVSTGRKPNIDGLGLDEAGVEFAKQGIKIDNKCRTTVNNIFACGDVAGSFQFTHYAEHMAKVAVSNAILKLPMKLDSKNIVWCTYTDPELSHAGASEEELKKKNVSYETYKFPFSKIDRAITDSDEFGLIKVYAKKFNGKIYGVDILGANAGEMIGEFALAIRNKVTLKNLADTIHPYPTYVLGNRRAADQWYIKKQSVFFVKLLQKIFGYKGSLPDLSDPERIV